MTVEVRTHADDEERPAWSLPSGGVPAIALDNPLPERVQVERLIVKPKVRGEALMSGYAYAHQGKPAPVVAARLAVGPIDKEVWAVGDRFWKTTGPTDAVPLTQMPLT